MKILATESLIIQFADYNSTKLMKRDSTKGIIVGTGQFYPGKSSIFSSLRRLGPFYPIFWTVHGVAYFAFWSRSAGRSAQTYER